MRFLAGLFVVLGSFNPYGFSYYDWVVSGNGMTAWKTMVGIGLLILHIVALLASVRSLGTIGVGLVTALFASAAWVLMIGNCSTSRIRACSNSRCSSYCGAVYGIGLSYSHIRARISGQYDSNDVTQNSPI